MSGQCTARHLARAELAGKRQLRDCLLDGQVARALRATDLAPTPRALGRLVLETSVCQQVRQTARAHQVPIGALLTQTIQQRYQTGGRGQ